MTLNVAAETSLPDGMTVVGAPVNRKVRKETYVLRLQDRYGYLTYDNHIISASY